MISTTIEDDLFRLHLNGWFQSLKGIIGDFNSGNSVEVILQSYVSIPERDYR